VLGTSTNEFGFPYKSSLKTIFLIVGAVITPRVPLTLNIVLFKN